MDLHTMIERANAQLIKRRNAANQTKLDISFVETLEANQPGAYTHTLKEMRTRLIRQQAALEATEGLIKSFNAALKKPSK